MSVIGKSWPSRHGPSRHGGEETQKGALFFQDKQQGSAKMAALNTIIGKFESSVRLESAGADPDVVVVDSLEVLEKARKDIEGAELLALDCEGVDLCRCGSLCIVQIATPSKCFLFDVLKKDCWSAMAQFLKGILEDPAITKVIHDCKMDADALLHLHGIRLVGVHDTQMCDNLLHGRGEKNLNDTLQLNGCKINVVRDKDVYERNPSFWATRPMSSDMREWASGDITSLFELYEIQISKASPEMRDTFKQASEDNAERLRNMIVDVSSLHLQWFWLHRGSLRLVLAELKAHEQQSGAC